jgi:hypothetical protein
MRSVIFAEALSLFGLLAGFMFSPILFSFSPMLRFASSYVLPGGPCADRGSLQRLVRLLFWKEYVEGDGLSTSAIR